MTSLFIILHLLYYMNFTPNPTHVDRIITKLIILPNIQLYFEKSLWKFVLVADSELVLVFCIPNFSSAAKVSMLY